jgi:hypothetical protein
MYMILVLVLCLDVLFMSTTTKSGGGSKTLGLPNFGFSSVHVRTRRRGQVGNVG